MLSSVVENMAHGLGAGRAGSVGSTVVRSRHSVLVLRIEGEIARESGLAGSWGVDHKS